MEGFLELLGGGLQERLRHGPADIVDHDVQAAERVPGDRGDRPAACPTSLRSASTARALRRLPPRSRPSCAAAHRGCARRRRRRRPPRPARPRPPRPIPPAGPGHYRYPAIEPEQVQYAHPATLPSVRALTPGCPSKALASSACRPGSASTRTSSPARRRVPGRIELAVPHDEADPRVARQPGQVTDGVPVGRQSGLVRRCTPLGSSAVARPAPTAQAGPSARAAGGPPRGQRALDHDREDDDHEDDDVEPLRVRTRRQAPVTREEAVPHPSAREQDEGGLVASPAVPERGRARRSAGGQDDERHRPARDRATRTSPARARGDRTVSPSTTNATISPRLDRAEWKRSTSPL